MRLLQGFISSHFLPLVSYKVFKGPSYNVLYCYGGPLLLLRSKYAHCHIFPLDVIETISVKIYYHIVVQRYFFTRCLDDKY